MNIQIHLTQHNRFVLNGTHTNFCFAKNRGLIRKCLIIFPIMLVFPCAYKLYAQEKRNQKGLFMGKWGEIVIGKVVGKQPLQPPILYPFTVELVDFPVQFLIGPFGGGGDAMVRINTTWPSNFTLVDALGIYCLLLPTI